MKLMHIILAGKASEVLAELEFMLKLQQALGHDLVRYQPETPCKN